MKAAKWLKWKIGAAFAVVLVIVFQFVRSSPQFQLQIDNNAAAKGTPENIGSQNDDEDGVMREWQQQDGQSDNAAPGSDFGGGRRFGRHSRGDGSGGSMQQGGSGFDGGDTQQGSGGFDTRTGRS